MARFSCSPLALVPLRECQLTSTLQEKKLCQSSASSPITFTGKDSSCSFVFPQKSPKENESVMAQGFTTPEKHTENQEVDTRVVVVKRKYRRKSHEISPTTKARRSKRILFRHSPPKVHQPDPLENLRTNTEFIMHEASGQSKDIFLSILGLKRRETALVVPIELLLPPENNSNMVNSSSNDKVEVEVVEEVHHDEATVMSTDIISDNDIDIEPSPLFGLKQFEIIRCETKSISSSSSSSSSSSPASSLASSSSPPPSYTEEDLDPDQIECLNKVNASMELMSMDDIVTMSRFKQLVAMKYKQEDELSLEEILEDGFMFYPIFA